MCAHLIQRLDGSGEPVHIRPAKGVHVTVPRSRVPADIAVVVNVPGDRRSIFVVPWGDRVYLGTTDTDYDGPIETPTCTADDVTYVLSAINAATTETLTNDDVLGTSAVLPLKPGTWYYRVRGFNYSLPTGAQQMSWSDPAKIVVAKPKFRVVGGGK